ncbi:MAG: hypothetical protein KQH57_13010 [Actinomycetales bacterium]|nr:hypothetical protein [Actinomycetales bacterium]
MTRIGSGMASGALLVAGGVLALAGCGSSSVPVAQVVQVTGTEVLNQTRDAVCSGDPLPLSGFDCPTLRDAAYTVYDDTSDARATGPGEAVLSCDMTESATAAGWSVVGECWGTRSVTNDGGSWQGTFTGTTTWSSDSPIHVHNLDGVLRGEGDYAGLRYRLRIVDGADGPWQLVGEIGPAD